MEFWNVHPAPAFASNDVLHRSLITSTEIYLLKFSTWQAEGSHLNWARGLTGCRAIMNRKFSRYLRKYLGDHLKVAATRSILILRCFSEVTNRWLNIAQLGKRIWNSTIYNSGKGCCPDRNFFWKSYLCTSWFPNKIFKPFTTDTEMRGLRMMHRTHS